MRPCGMHLIKFRNFRICCCRCVLSRVAWHFRVVFYAKTSKRRRKKYRYRPNWKREWKYINSLFTRSRTKRTQDLRIRCRNNRMKTIELQLHARTPSPPTPQKYPAKTRANAPNKQKTPNTYAYNSINNRIYSLNHCFFICFSIFGRLLSCFLFGISLLLPHSPTLARSLCVAGFFEWSNI